MMENSPLVIFLIEGRRCELGENVSVDSHISETNVQSGRENHELLENELTKEEYKCRQFF